VGEGRFAAGGSGGSIGAIRIIVRGDNPIVSGQEKNYKNRNIINIELARDSLL
jgi:hypothetical protein